METPLPVLCFEWACGSAGLLDDITYIGQEFGTCCGRTCTGSSDIASMAGSCFDNALYVLFFGSDCVIKFCGGNFTDDGDADSCDCLFGLFVLCEYIKIHVWHMGNVYAEQMGRRCEWFFGFTSIIYGVRYDGAKFFCRLVADVQERLGLSGVIHSGNAIFREIYYFLKLGRRIKMGHIIDVVNVSKKFGSETVVNDVSLSLDKGKIYGIIGRNGSGKTVLFKMIIGFLRPSSGKIFVDGLEIGKDTDFAKETGIIIETPGFLGGLSGYKNLEYLASINNKIGKAEIREYMGKVGLDPDNRKKVRKYSLGMRQRLGIAQAIMENPHILILDEPMNGLDKQGVEDMRTLFLNLKKQGVTILLASHNREDIDILCDKVYEIDDGYLHCMT